MISKKGDRKTVYIHNEAFNCLCTRHTIITDKEILKAYRLMVDEQVYPLCAEFIMFELKGNHLYEWFCRPELMSVQMILDMNEDLYNVYS